jgi:hypothetical protein
MYENGKMTPVETILGMGERELRRMMEWMNSSMIYFVNVTMYPQYNNNVIIKNKTKLNKNRPFLLKLAYEFSVIPNIPFDVFFFFLRNQQMIPSFSFFFFFSEYIYFK